MEGFPRALAALVQVAREEKEDANVVVSSLIGMIVLMVNGGAVPEESLKIVQRELIVEFEKPPEKRVYFFGPEGNEPKRVSH